MKRLFMPGLMLAAVVTIILATTYVGLAYAAPAVVGAAVLGKSLTTISGALGLPTWLIVFVFLALCPWFIVWVLRAVAKRRARLALLVVSLAIAYLLARAIVNHKQDAFIFSSRAFSGAERIFSPVVRVNPADTAWFYPSGDARLYYEPLGDGNWAFFEAYSGAHDPESGILLMPVTRALRAEWTAAVRAAKVASDARQQIVEERRQTEDEAEKSRLEREFAAERQMVDKLLQAANAATPQTPAQVVADPPPAAAPAVPSAPPSPPPANVAATTNPPVYCYYQPAPAVTYYYYPASYPMQTWRYVRAWPSATAYYYYPACYPMQTYRVVPHHYTAVPFLRWFVRRR